MFTNPTFWLAVSFTIFVVLAFRPILKAITPALDARAARIAKELDEARAIREEAMAVLATAEAATRSAHAEAEAVIARAAAASQGMKTEALARLSTELERREAQAMERIARAEREAIARVRREAAELARAASEQVLAETLTGATGSSAIDRAIGQIKTRLN